MANFETTADLKSLALDKAGEPVDGSSDFDSRVVEYINYLYLSILSGSSEYNVDLGQAWAWAKAQDPGIIVLQPFVEDGTISLTQNSTAGTFSSAPAASMQRRFLTIEGESEVPRIVAHTGGLAAFTLDAVFTGETGSYNYKAMELEKDLPAGVLRVISPFRVQRRNEYFNQEVTLLSKNAFDRDFPINHPQQGIPTFMTKVYETQGTMTVRFNRFVEELTRVEFDYIPEPTALTASPDTSPIIPKDFRMALAYGAAHQIAIDKSDDKANTFFAMTNQKLKSMVEDNLKELSLTNYRRNSRLIPRRDQLRDRPSGDFFPWRY